VTAREVLKNFDDLMALFRGRLGSDIEDFPRDGWVLKVKQEKLRQKYGVGTDVPKWAVAIKFVNSQVQTRLLGIKWQVSRLGVVTPVARLQPADIDGVTVTSASLHNLAECKRLGLAIPCTVMVERAGMVIPQVTKVVDTAGGEKWTKALPARCPKCGERLCVEMPRLVCRNKACSARKTCAFLNLLGAFEIKDFQEARIVDLVDRGILKDPCDLFSLEPADLAPSLGETMAAKLVKNIQASLAGKVSKERFLTAFGIDGLGESTARKLLDHVDGDLERVFGLSVEEIASVKGLGTSVGKKVVEGFAGQGTGLWECLREKILFKGDIESAGPWSGLTFCLTGRFSGPKKALEDLIVSKGASVVGGVKKGLDYLVHADPASVSEKSRRAKELGVKVLSEDAFWGL
jgi:DNA ligase (NAD+)